MEHLSVKYICRNTEVRDNSVQINPRINDCKIEDCTDLREISSVSRVELESKEKVRKTYLERVFKMEDSGNH